jgi:hypothetical protein
VQRCADFRLMDFLNVQHSIILYIIILYYINCTVACGTDILESLSPSRLEECVRMWHGRHGSLGALTPCLLRAKGA